MSQNIEALSSLTKKTIDTGTHLDIGDNSVSVHDGNFKSMVSSLFDEFSSTHSQIKNEINYLTHSKNFSSDPETLLRIQNISGEYSNSVLLISTLTRKLLAAVETLGK